MASQFIAGIDIGGTKIAAAIGLPGGKVIACHSLHTDQDSLPEESMNAVFIELSRMAESHHGQLIAAGIGCAGPLNLEDGSLLAPPNMPPNWRYFQLRSFVESRLRIPVVVENDANAAAVGELHYGAGRGVDDLVYLTISTGIGGGIIANRQLVYRRGEAGHITVNPGGALCGCGARGCLEAECSGLAIARRAREQLLMGRPSQLEQMVEAVNQVTARTVEQAARERDDLACEVWEETVRLMAIGIGGIIALLAPQAVILGGGVAVGAGEFLLAPLRTEIDKCVRIVDTNGIRLHTAELGSMSGLCGALALAETALDKPWAT